MIIDVVKKKLDNTIAKIIGILFVIFCVSQIIISIAKFYSLKLSYQSPLIPDYLIENLSFFWLIESILYLVPFGLSLYLIWKKYKYLILAILIAIITIELVEFILIFNGNLLK
jgi:hypothetical protein